MNFNYDIITLFYYYIGSMFCCFGMLFSEKILFQKSFKTIKWYSYPLILLFSLFILLNNLVFDNIVKIFGSILILYLIAKIIFKKDFLKGFLYCIIVYIIFLIAEVTMSLLLVLFENVFHAKILSIIEARWTIFINVTISILACIYSNIMKFKIKRIVEKITKNGAFYILIIGVITIFVLLSTMYSLYLNSWKIDYILILNLVIFIGCTISFFVHLKQHLNGKEMIEKYKLLNEYLKTSADIIEKYSSTVHKYKNNLISIKGYLKKDPKKAEEYMDSLIENYDSKKYNWFNKINYIQLDAIRYLIYYKLSKAENYNLKIIVDVSESIKKYKNDTLSIGESNTLLDIIGELFDNAIYACNDSKEKELNIVLYQENDYLIFILSNTYKGKIDLAQISKNGYTTKGKGHGLGLYDIDKTIKKNNKFKIKYETLDNYFVVTLTICIKK